MNLTIAGSKFAGFLDVRQVTAVREHLKLSTGDQIPERRPIGGGNKLVVVAPDDECRATDTMQPLAQVGIIKSRLPA